LIGSRAQATQEVGVDYAIAQDGTEFSAFGAIFGIGDAGSISP
jgi:hypothetical protein